jgi:hypothetical protein
VRWTFCVCKNGERLGDALVRYPIGVHPSCDVPEPLCLRVHGRGAVHGELVGGFVGGRGERVGSENGFALERVVLGLPGVRLACRLG